MKTRIRLLVTSVAVGAALTLVFSLRLMAGAPTTPEEVGLSTERLGRITEMMRRHITTGEISGGVTLVARHGRIAHLEAHGAMDMESKQPMPKDAVFRIASMTKPVTGTAVMMMMEEGKLRITDPVSKYIPQFNDMNVAVAKASPRGPVANDEPLSAPQFYTVPAEREITIRDLLTHTSGLVSGPLSSSEVRRVGARKPTDTLADYTPRLGGTALEFQPGSRWAYSATAGFDTLGRIVEITSGQSFDQFLKQRLFDPLGMKDVSFYATDALASRMPSAYQLVPKGVQKNTNASTMQSQVYFMGSGGLISTAEDYWKFGQMLLNGGELNGRRLLSPRTIDYMKSVHIPDTLPGRAAGEGYGLSVRVIEHAAAGAHRISDGSFGWSGAYGTHFWIDPKEDIVAIMMIQTPVREMRPEFENAVMQAIVK
jgi:CubicO group peptidase (beta-lactamase class C family)